MVKTVDELVEAFGGTSAFADVFGFGRPNVSRARTENRLPHPWRLPVYREAERRKMKVDPILLGLDPDEQPRSRSA